MDWLESICLFLKTNMDEISVRLVCAIIVAIILPIVFYFLNIPKKLWANISNFIEKRKKAQEQQDYFSAIKEIKAKIDKEEIKEWLDVVIEISNAN